MLYKNRKLMNRPSKRFLNDMSSMTKIWLNSSCSFSKRQFSSNFRLPSQFVDEYRSKQVNFGFNGLGEIAYLRTYSRIKQDGSNEQWADTVERVVNGWFTIQNRYANAKIDDPITLSQAMRMYDKIYNFKFLPPGRGIWAMGSAITQDKKMYAALNNCAFVSTVPVSGLKNSRPFTFLMDSSMLGVGVGFDTKGADQIKIYRPDYENRVVFEIPDSREGWVESVEMLLDSYFEPNKKAIEFDYQKIRSQGSPLKTFGGISSGPAPLIELHKIISERLKSKTPEDTLTMRDIVDLMNFIGKWVVSGNVRRSAEIAMGEYNDKDFIELKNYEKNPDRMDYGWVSNNSIFAKIGMDYTDAVENIIQNGEPGFAWLENMKNYGRMADSPDFKDINAQGGNPCLEQTLESYEIWNLVETFPNHHNSYRDFLDTLELAFLYAKTVTLGLSHWDETKEVMSRNRRIGCSISGVAQFISDRSLSHLKSWLYNGYKHLRQYDSYISKEFDVPESIKITSVKPSGTVSLLAGATPGMHFPESQFYIRRVRLSKHNALVPILEEAGYKIEDDVYTPETVCIEVPVNLGPKIRTLASDVSMWEQVSLASFLQKYWADNQVSWTVTFDPIQEADSIKPALEYFQYSLKGISFLPRSNSSYQQMPYEQINESEYSKAIKQIKKVELSKKLKESQDILPDPDAENFWTNDSWAL